MPHELLDEHLIGPFIRDLGALMHASTVLVGDRLGLYRAMADSQWVSAAELAAPGPYREWGAVVGQRRAGRGAEARSDAERLQPQAGQDDVVRTSTSGGGH